MMAKIQNVSLEKNVVSSYSSWFITLMAYYFTRCLKSGLDRILIFDEKLKILPSGNKLPYHIIISQK